MFFSTGANFGSFLGQFGQFWVIFRLFWVIFRPFFGANFFLAKYASALFKSLFATLEVAPNLVEILAKRRDRVRPVFQQRLDRIEKVRFTLTEKKSHR